MLSVTPAFAQRSTNHELSRVAVSALLAKSSSMMNMNSLLL
jgi:hypothetical protein